MAKKEFEKRRFITLELNPTMSDKDEEEFKKWVLNGIKDLALQGNNAALILPKIALRTLFEDESNIIIVNKNNLSRNFKGFNK